MRTKEKTKAQAKAKTKAKPGRALHHTMPTFLTGKSRPSAFVSLLRAQSSHILAPFLYDSHPDMDF